MSVRIVALLALAASLSLAPSNASAFGHLFGHRASGCDACGCAAPSCGCEMAAPSCGCEIAPSCGCEVVDPCCDPCGGKRLGLFAKLRARRAAKSCCAPAPSCGCEVAAPSCGCEIAAPSCGCEIAAPSCGCEVVDPCCDPCAGKKRGGLLKGLFSKLHSRKSSCCAPAPSCGCEVAAPSCGCELTPSCGCGM